MGAAYVERPFTLTFTEDEHAVLEWPDGERRVVPVRVLRVEHKIVEAGLAAYDKARGEAVLPEERQYTTRH